MIFRAEEAFAARQQHPKQHSASLFCLQARLDELESELLEVNANSERLQRSYSELLELQLVLEKAGSFFDDAQHRASSSQFECELGLAFTKMACISVTLLQGCPQSSQRPASSFRPSVDRNLLPAAVFLQVMQ